MNDDTEPGTPTEAHMLIAGALGWAGYVVRCRECGAMTGWRLSAHPDTDPGHAPADVADLTCPEGHTQRHPLVYPEMVRALVAACDGDLTGLAAAGALRAIGWRPHNRVVRHGAVTYLPWEYEPGPDEGSWPDLHWVYQGGALPRPPVLSESLTAPEDAVTGGARAFRRAVDLRRNETLRFEREECLEGSAGPP